MYYNVTPRKIESKKVELKKGTSTYLKKDNTRSSNKEVNYEFNYSTEEIDYNLESTTGTKEVDATNLFSIIKELRKKTNQNTALTIEFNEKIKNIKPYTKEYYDTCLDYKIKLSGGYGTREASVVSAKYLSEEYTINGKNLPYFWGGKRLAQGVDETWGNMRTIAGSGTKEQPLGEEFPYGMDCSGYVAWVLYNSGYNIDVYYSDGIISHCTNNGGINYTFSLDTFQKNDIKAGDILYRDIKSPTEGKSDHIAIITEYDKKNGTIKFAEEKGGKGLIATEMNINEFIKKYNNDTYGFNGIISMDNYYSNKDNLIK